MSLGRYMLCRSPFRGCTCRYSGGRVRAPPPAKMPAGSTRSRAGGQQVTHAAPPLQYMPHVKRQQDILDTIDTSARNKKEALPQSV
eukprot:6006417-Pyramimonas_sp.AAC.5